MAFDRDRFRSRLRPRPRRTALGLCHFFCLTGLKGGKGWLEGLRPSSRLPVLPARHRSSLHNTLECRRFREPYWCNARGGTAPLVWRLEHRKKPYLGQVLLARQPLSILAQGLSLFSRYLTGSFTTLPPLTMRRFQTSPVSLSRRSEMGSLGWATIVNR